MICFIFSLFRCPTLCKKVTLGAEVGEEVALGVLAAQILEKGLFEPQDFEDTEKP